MPYNLDAPTKGPWTYDKGVIFGADGIGVGQVQRTAYPEIAAANGCLMAAAPELLAELESLLHVVSGLGEAVPHMLQEKASQVVAKARGTEFTPFAPCP